MAGAIKDCHRVMIKKCVICGDVFERRVGNQRICLETQCKKELIRKSGIAWRKANSKHIRKMQDKWRASNAGRIRESNHKNYTANRDRYLEKARRRTKEYPEHVRELSRKWRRNNPDLARAHQLKWRTHNRQHVMDMSQKYNAKKRPPSKYTTNLFQLLNLATKIKPNEQ